MIWQDHIPSDIADLYEVFDWQHASAILASDLSEEFTELCTALRAFRFTENQVRSPGGNESAIPKTFSTILRPLGWEEAKMTAKLVVDESEVSRDTHKVDYCKGRIACDVEWNSKDQTFDRDLYAFRAFHEYGRISVGVLITRSNELDGWFDHLGIVVDAYGTTRPIKSKFGASTTHIGKLLPRLQSGRSGGCPVLVLGITTRLLAED